MTRRRVRTALLGGLSILVTAIGGVVVGAPVAEAKPTYKVSTVVSGLTTPWDLTWVGDLMLFDQRGGSLWSQRGSAQPKKVSISLSGLYVNNEGGLLGIVADPSAAKNKKFYTCQTWNTGGGNHDVRVLRWRLTSDTKAVSDGSPVVTGMPVSSGRHSGCRLRFGPDGMLYVGTGDAAQTGNSQNLQSLGGKVLRVAPNGDIPTDNPFYGQGGKARYVWSYGHRNVQGLAFRPGTSELWSAEHGTYRDDEVNTIVRGGNYGWQALPGYNESPPMTDLQKYPDAISAKWSSGNPTVATSGLTFFNSSAWGQWQGAAAVGLLKGTGIKILVLDPTGKVADSSQEISGLGSYGRIRTVFYGPDKALYFTTSNGGGSDRIGKITPTTKAPTLTGGTNVASVGVSAARTGQDLYAFIRTTGDAIVFKRSTDDGRTWPSAWTSTGLTSTTAPAVTSSASGRVDLVTRSSKGAITHTWFVNGVRAGQTSLGGSMTTATISSVGDGTLDVFGLGTTGTVSRKHFAGSWSGWKALTGGLFTSAVGASVDHETGATLITARSRAGKVYERSLTASSNGSAWVKGDGLLWSGRALGDRYDGRTAVAFSKTADGYARFQQGKWIQGLNVKISSDPDVVTRPDGTWVLFARNSSGALSYYDARPGQYVARSLGGTVR
ncbi:MAG TPA: PQQ-dependent sugar dehydrogenase [Propionibacteriaceae bacterium]